MVHLCIVGECMSAVKLDTTSAISVCICICLHLYLLQEEAEDDSDLSDYGEETDGKKDALAEPCFMLIGEIFELRGSEYSTLHRV